MGAIFDAPVGADPTPVAPGVHALNVDFHEALIDYVAEQTLATELRLEASGAGEEASFHEGHIGGQTLRVGIQLASST